MRFAYPELLWLLLLVPLLLLLRGRHGAAPSILFPSTTVATDPGLRPESK